MARSKFLKTFFKIFWRISTIILLYRHPGKTDDGAAAKGGKGAPFGADFVFALGPRGFQRASLPKDPISPAQPKADTPSRLEKGPVPGLSGGLVRFLIVHEGCIGRAIDPR
ncbi:MAG: hypothetical protein JWM21_3045 [Acidobacteria bacterium]|nr:hypothetical protein [Acidobacteriota bacterium]